MYAIMQKTIKTTLALRSLILISSLCVGLPIHAQQPVAQASQPLPEQYRGMDFGQPRIQGLPLFKNFNVLKAEGVLSQKPQQRNDYNDIYLPKKPLKFLQQDVVLLSDEYLSEYIGCCVNEGWGALIRRQISMQGLQKFAEQNECLLQPLNVKEDSDYYGYSLKKLGVGQYYKLSCREGDRPIVQ